MNLVDQLSGRKCSVCCQVVKKNYYRNAISYLLHIKFVLGGYCGVISCRSCQKFFEHSIRSHANYNCQGNKDCIIDQACRNRCKYCRLQKCYETGMRSEAVQNECQLSKSTAQMVGDQKLTPSEVEGNSNSSTAEGNRMFSVDAEDKHPGSSSASSSSLQQQNTYSFFPLASTPGSGVDTITKQLNQVSKMPCSLYGLLLEALLLPNSFTLVRL